MTILSYRGYQATATFEDDRIVIHVLHVDDHLVAECTDATQVRRVFHELIDDYLEDCKLVGKEPDKPYKGVFNVRVSPDLHRSAARSATSLEMTLNDFVGRALESYVATYSNESDWAAAVYHSSVNVAQPVHLVRVDDDDTTLSVTAEVVAWAHHQRH